MTSMTARVDDVINAPDVIGGVDTHSRTHHAAALDAQGRLLGSAQFSADGAGYRDLLTWLRSFGTVGLVGIEGTSSYGAGLTRYLQQENVSVVEVNRPDRRLRALRGKSDPLDAENAARRALASTHQLAAPAQAAPGRRGAPRRRPGESVATPKDTTTVIESVRALRVARQGAIKARIAALNQLKALITTAPEQLRAELRRLPLKTAAAEAARYRPDTARLSEPMQATKWAMRSIGRRVEDLTAEIDALSVHLTDLLSSAAPKTMALFGVGTEHAGQLLVTAGGNPQRLGSEAAFAALCGASPIPASSGITNRHRLQRGGDRHANSALYLIAVVRMRYCPVTRAYVERRTKEGLSKRDILRCLKRYIARQAYNAIMQDLGRLTTAPPAEPAPMTT
ncbi:transposase IS116/IS110/IS902 family protein [Kineococcus xinjiangensis]|uniref:Transposase IS116/IS110/IS902 family protein n=1 Tax=Kineococcus xinjiangensis TaxID=512762 RepID=A0A2S6IC31_9ACTN|nr:transposase [Kineococcus xinjiangensis]PPK90190.1 transposase IS116/IS110/IS902 family protein [Kineococcus xinjiangensis]